MAAGTGTPGANQDGVLAAPAYSPGEVVMAAGPLSINAPDPAVDITVGSQFVTKAYDLAVYPSLRPELIFDQFATVKAENVTHRGGSVRFSFVYDLDEQTTPLLENIDVDSIALNSKAITVAMREYGTAVTNTALLRGTSMVPIDPIAAERVGYNAGKSIDTLARVALDATSVTYDDGSTVDVEEIGTSADYLDSWMLRDGVAMLKSKNVRPFAGRANEGGTYVAVISPYQAQHLMSDSAWRSQIVFQNNQAGNSVFTGEIGTFEGVRIVVNNHLTAMGQGYLMGAEAFAKAYSSASGFGPNPSTVVSPVVDKLRRFASVGWYHLVGYSIFRADALIHLTTASTLMAKPA